MRILETTDSKFLGMEMNIPEINTEVILPNDFIFEVNKIESREENRYLISNQNYQILLGG